VASTKESPKPIDPTYVERAREYINKELKRQNLDMTVGEDRLLDAARWLQQGWGIDVHYEEAEWREDGVGDDITYGGLVIKPVFDVRND